MEHPIRHEGPRKLVRSRFALRHLCRDEGDLSILDDLDVELIRLHIAALQRGHSRTEVESIKQEIIRQVGRLLSPKPRDHPALRAAAPASFAVYSTEQLEQIERDYPKLIPGDSVYLPEAIPHPSDVNSPALYDVAVVQDIRRVFANGCVEVAAFALFDFARQEYCLDGRGEAIIVELRTRGMIVTAHAVDTDTAHRYRRIGGKGAED